MGKGSAGSGSVGSGSAGYSGKGISSSAKGTGYSSKAVCPGIKSMYGAAPVGIEARLTITSLTEKGAGYQSLLQQVYQPLARSTEPYLSRSSPETYLAGSPEQHLACPQCGSDFPYEPGSEVSSLAMSVLLGLMREAMQEPGEDFYRKACPACMIGGGEHTCGR